jgi:hypothetical protein
VLPILDKFSASPEEKSASEENIQSASNMHFFEEFGLKKNTVFVYLSRKIKIYLELP